MTSTKKQLQDSTDLIRNVIDHLNEYYDKRIQKLEDALFQNYITGYNEGWQACYQHLPINLQDAITITERESMARMIELREGSLANTNWIKNLLKEDS